MLLANIGPVLLSPPAEAAVSSPSKWIRYSGNPVISAGQNGAWDDDASWLYSGSVIYNGTGYWMYYGGYDGTNQRTGLATSADGKSWTKYASNPVLPRGSSGSWDATHASGACVMLDGTTYKMWYHGFDGSHWRLGYATSGDGISWTKYSGNPVLTLGANGAWDDNHLVFPSVIKDQDGYRMWYGGEDGANFKIGYATSPDGINWTKYAQNPVLGLGANNAWDDQQASQCSVLNMSGTYCMWYSGNSGQRWCIGYATSSDGTSWTKHAQNPVLGGQGNGWEQVDVLIPYLVHDGTTYLMWYTGTDGSGKLRIGYAEGWNSPPNAPALTAPADDVWTNVSRPAFKWTFSDNNSQDSQKAYQLQLSQNSTFDSPDLDTGRVNSTTAAYTPGSAISDGIYYWRVRTWDNDDDVGGWSAARIVKIDTTGPKNPTSVLSDSHSPEVWSNDTTISMRFSGATDAGSGLLGYSIVWDNSNDTLPDNVTELNSTAFTNTSPPMADNATVYFHIRAVDNVHNSATDAAHAGPFRIDTSPPLNPSVASGTHEVSVWSNVTVCAVGWTGANGTLSGIGGYSVAWDHLASTTPDANIEFGGAVGEGASPPLSDDTWYFHIRTVDEAGNWAPLAAHFGPVLVDSSAPSNPLRLNSSHAASAWSNDNTVNISWSGQSGPISGIDGFSYSWDTAPDTVPADGATCDANTNSVSSPVLADAMGYYFHVKAVDRAGNWNATAVHYGPIWIDASAPDNPGPLQSTSHSVGVWSNVSVVSVGWPLGDGGRISGYQGFSVVWDNSADTLPDATAELSGDTCATRSPAMPDGAGVYFHLRAVDRAGNWATTAAHLGPFNIDTSLPSNPKSLSALSQTPGKWSGIATATAVWSGAASPLSGIAGYAVLWDRTPATLPPAGGVDLTAGNETCTTVLADGDNWYFHVRAKNNAGSWAAGAVHLGPILIDLTPPATTAVVINSNEGFTGSSTVTVNLTATDATPGSGVAELSLSVDGTNWGGWELFSASRSVTVPDGSGTRTVHARTRDAVGNVGAARSDDIVVDKIAPAGLAIQINGGAPASNSRTVSLALSATDPEPASGTGEMSFSEDGSSWSPWEPFKTTRDWTFRSDGNRTVFFRARDTVLNAAGPVSAAILVDTSLPKMLGATVTRTGTKSAAVQVTTDEPCTVVIEYGTGRTYGSTVRTDGFSTDATLEIPQLKAGTNYHFRVSVTDRGGNPATVSEDQRFVTKSDAKTPVGPWPLAGALAVALLLGLSGRRGRRRPAGPA